MSILTDIVNSGEPWAAERAQYTTQVIEAVNTGQLSASEGKEILADIIRSATLADVSANAQLQAALICVISAAADAMM
jgi:polyhydroxyalkanoate synthesis regulator phasin